MGSGSWSAKSFASYSTLNHKSYDYATGRVSGQTYTASYLDPALDPKGVIRECVNSDEHPNTIPVILALDVTGSMGAACKECAEVLNVLMTNLYKKYKDIEFMVMGIGDLSYDTAPVQASQFESDIRIAEQMDKIWMEHGGGGNSWESYTAAWYFGLNHCKLDCWKQGRKGIIITMGDESVNPCLKANSLQKFLGGNVQADVDTKPLYKEASQKYDIYHIAVNDPHTMWKYHASEATIGWFELLKDNFIESTINELVVNISKCIDKSVDGFVNNTQAKTSNDWSWTDTDNSDETTNVSMPEFITW